MKDRLNQQTIKKLDKSNMLDLLLGFPQQCKAALDIAEKSKILFSRQSSNTGRDPALNLNCPAGEKRDFSNIVFAGLGGSAIGADLVRSYLYFESKIPIQVFREYDLPAFVDDSALVFLSSYSGNTEETLSAYEQARKRKATLIVISSDGKLKEYAQRDNVTFIGIPQGSPPRCNLGYLSIIPLCVLAKLGLIKDVGPSVSQMIYTLDELKNKNLNPRIGQKDNIAKQVALKLLNKFTIIYSASIHFDICATRLRGEIAENSKALGSSHVFPEMNHNEIVGWQEPKKLFKNLVVVMLRDKDMNKRVLMRMDITRDLIKKEGPLVLEVWSRGENLLSRIFSLIYIGDFVSFYLALLYGIDPTPVEKVTYLKNQLAKK